MKKKTIGIIMIVLAALAFLGSFVNDTSNENIGFYIGYYGAMVALVAGGIYFILQDSKTKPQ